MVIAEYIRLSQADRDVMKKEIRRKARVSRTRGI